MHELGITQNIVSIVAEHANHRPVNRVVLEVGTLAGVMTELDRLLLRCRRQRDGARRRGAGNPADRSAGALPRLRRGVRAKHPF